MTVDDVLAESEWRGRAAAYLARLDELVGPYLERRAAGNTHPVVDFLFTYYGNKPAQLRRWHPGFGIGLAGAREYEGARGYHRVSVPEWSDRLPAHESFRHAVTEISDGAAAREPSSTATKGRPGRAVAHESSRHATTEISDRAAAREQPSSAATKGPPGRAVAGESTGEGAAGPERAAGPDRAAGSERAAGPERAAGRERAAVVFTADPAYLARRRDTLEFVANLLRATASRPAQLSCFGLHEWAMVYRTDDVRHRQVPLRLGSEGTDAVVEAMSLRCTHFDAFRFFTPEAVGRNAQPLTRADQVAREQPGCLHANMDLYKWSFKLVPLVASQLVLDCFELACDARELDMRASPYDLTDYGYAPIRIETPSGRAEYVRRQAEIAERSATLRAALLDACKNLLAASPEHAAR
ncbi:hypothetical protein APR11_000418 [Nocardia amikacinitolerans]|nr:hypothetical protein [Nocardia amikacinitolerans]